MPVPECSSRRTHSFVFLHPLSKSTSYSSHTTRQKHHTLLIHTQTHTHPNTHIYADTVSGPLGPLPCFSSKEASTCNAPSQMTASSSSHFPLHPPLLYALPASAVRLAIPYTLPVSF
jgi:hypothetical protein